MPGRQKSHLRRRRPPYPERDRAHEKWTGHPTGSTSGGCRKRQRQGTPEATQKPGNRGQRPGPEAHAALEEGTDANGICRARYRPHSADCPLVEPQQKKDRETTEESRQDKSTGTVPTHALADRRVIPVRACYPVPRGTVRPHAVARKARIPVPPDYPVQRCLTVGSSGYWIQGPGDRLCLPAVALPAFACMHANAGKALLEA